MGRVVPCAALAQIVAPHAPVAMTGRPNDCEAGVGAVTAVLDRTNTHYPAMTSRCIQSSNAVGSIEGFANKAYWLAPKTPGR